MSAPMDLRRGQEFFWALISAPEGVRPALEDMARRGAIPSPTLDDFIRGDGGLGAIERLDIYANMYFFRLLDCLKEDSPRLAVALGADRFHNLVTDYLLRHPSENPSLRHLSRHLVEFVRGHALSSELPWLADLARLELARLDAFDAPDARPLTRADLAAMPAEAAGEVRLVFVPAHALLRFEHDVAQAWSALKPAAADGESHDPAPIAVPRRDTRVRVWRNDFVVYHRAVGEEEARCLDLAAAGESLGALCQQIAAGHSISKATTRVGRMLQTWLDDGILARLDPPA